jgi:hypothetical protein
LNFLNFESKLLQQEKETWILLQLIFEDFSKKKEDKNEIEMKKEEYWRLSHLQLVERLKNLDPNFRRQMVTIFEKIKKKLVVHWLEYICEEVSLTYSISGDFEDSRKNKKQLFVISLSNRQRTFFH